ncbi:hypothetical protein ABEV54_08770 [Peribacillus psychrosaccharolyticus]|uniref:hypothetical protein n=1 Tax=Peribacillus psychrosaccharolyticus TaxID=1407 RepID=UPI003D2D6A3F
MYKKLIVVLPLAISLAVLQGCGDNSREDGNKEEKTAVEKVSEPKVEIDEEEVEEPVKFELEEVSIAVKTNDNVTADDFNAMFTQESEEKFPNGKYELKDGTIINADTFSYVSSDFFDYANVVFFDGKIAHMQIESKSSIEEIEQGIGVSFEGARIEEFKFGTGYEIIFNEKFADENIAVYPNEW